jgi:hypothetical protein
LYEEYLIEYDYTFHLFDQFDLDHIVKIFQLTKI